MDIKTLKIGITQKTFKNIWLCKKPGVKDIDLSFASGTTTLIMGTSGAGKSTLIKCLLRRCRYEGKATYFNGSSESTTYKHSIAYIPQHPALNNQQTVYSAIYYACRFSYLSASKKDIEKVVKHYIAEMGLQKFQNSSIGSLSGGQRQRVSIAKELVRGKEIIIADEIDTGLDCGLSRSLIRKLQEVTRKENKITIIISHNVSNMDLYDDVAVIVKDSAGWGRVAFSGEIKNLKRFFGVNEYYNILHKLNSEEEHGQGQADFFIKKFAQSEKEK